MKYGLSIRISLNTTEIDNNDIFENRSSFSEKFDLNYIIIHCKILVCKIILLDIKGVIAT